MASELRALRTALCVIRRPMFSRTFEDVSVSDEWMHVLWAHRS